ncbi:MAG TPA: gaf sensor protein [Balneolaceae bacterium]|nr:gaf sensor protein [Balneola sp.]HBQ60942.1 gaf sensor protein [Balneolaceae bacterium]|tara:strand:+ start:145264 stop:145734 length:471 start_codon:yes stop_codon:yes gene_type:complete
MSSAETATNQIISHIKDILDKDLSRDEKLLSICKTLSSEVETFDWVGFYFADPDGKDELVLGPFVGESTDHTRIPFGRGICGQVAVSHETFVSQNVHEEDNYIACSMDVQSEIVVPIMKDNQFVAQIDIDSNTRGSITKDQRVLLEQIAELLKPEF